MTANTIDEMIDLAAELEDQTIETTGGDFTYDPPAAGPTLGRLIEYIELGTEKQKPYQGKAKPDSEMVRLTWELLLDKNKKEYEVEGEKKIRYDTISLTLKKSLNERAKFRKIFKAMDYGRGMKHMAKFLNNVFIITVYHNTGKSADGTERTYANIQDKDGNLGINAPYREDVLAGTKQDISAACPPAHSPLKLFLFDHPNKATWDSLYIDGTREEKNEAGETTQRTKNWIQERILKSVKYKGSALETMLTGGQPKEIQEAIKETVTPPFTPDSEGMQKDSEFLMGTLPPENDATKADVEDEEAALMAKLEATRARKAQEAAKAKEATTVPVGPDLAAGGASPATVAASQPSSAAEALAALGLN